MKFNFDKEEGVLEISTILSDEYVSSTAIIGDEGEIRANGWVFIQIYKPTTGKRVAVPSIKLDFGKKVAESI